MNDAKPRTPGIVAEGTVKVFDLDSGNGFISRKDDADVFVNYEAIRGDGPRTLAVGDRVTVEVVAGPKGPRARSVHRL
jgi:CspA family cold shock protein